MNELVSTVEAAIEALEDFLERQKEPGASAAGAHDVLNRLAARAADAAALSHGQLWDERILADEEIFDSAPVPLLITDPMGFVLRANAKLLELGERTQEQVSGLHVGDYIHKDDYHTLADLWVRMQVETEFNSAITEFRLLAPRGPRWFRAAIRSSRNEDLSLAHLIVHLADVDNKYAAEKALDRSERTFGNLLDSLPDPITRVNRAFEVQFANPAAKAYRHLSPVQEWPHVVEEDRERYVSAAELCWSTGESRTVEHGMIAGDEVLWCETTFVAEVGPSSQVEALLILWRDHTNRRRHEKLLAHRAMHDSLTGLPNRSRFSELLELAIARQAAAAELEQTRPLAVLFLDLDRFKFVNDSLGHLAGDDLLRGVSRRLSSAIRPGDVIGRLGGDEFTILAEDISSEDAILMAERIQEQLKRPFNLNGREFIVTASIGVVSSDNPEAATDLMRWADSAMYRAKSLGRSRVATYEEVLAPDVMDRLDTDQLIRSAVERNELELHFQPEVLLATTQIVGVEALLRWHHPIKGLIGADKFIPLAEDNGSIIPIGAWVLRKACEQVSAWDAEGLISDAFVLRVNLSPRQLDVDTLAQQVAEILSETNFPASRLCLEITETGLMREVDQALLILGELAEVGISLAVDDFGTGYSSLSSLKRFPIDVLKIDKSFISGISHGTRDSAIVRTILKLAETLNLVATAEGVETEAQRQHLRQMGCRRGQGYLFSRPIPADQFEELLRSGIRVSQSPVHT